MNEYIMLVICHMKCAYLLIIVSSFMCSCIHNSCNKKLFTILQNQDTEKPRSIDSACNKILTPKNYSESPNCFFNFLRYTNSAFKEIKTRKNKFFAKTNKCINPLKEKIRHPSNFSYISREKHKIDWYQSNKVTKNRTTQTIYKTVPAPHISQVGFLYWVNAVLSVAQIISPWKEQREKPSLSAWSHPVMVSSKLWPLV